MWQENTYYVFSSFEFVAKSVTLFKKTGLASQVLSKSLYTSSCSAGKSENIQWFYTNDNHKQDSGNALYKLIISQLGNALKDSTSDDTTFH